MACATNTGDGAPEPATPAGAAAVLVAGDLPTDEPYDTWEVDDDVDAPGSTGEHGTLPACQDLAAVSETYAQDLVSTMQSPTFYTSSRGGPTSVSLYAHDTVYRYGSDESAREAFESIDADLFAACISLNVTPGSEDAVADHVVDEDDRSIDGHDGIVLRTDAMQDSTFFGGYDNEREADLIAVLLGTEVIVFEFVVSGQSVDFLGVDPLDAELDAVESVLERAGP